MTLGDLIDKLAAIKPTYVDCNGEQHDKQVLFDFGDCVPGEFHSWRGSYEELALSFRLPAYPFARPTLTHFLGQCRAVVGAHLDGWKGGRYEMTLTTPLWVSLQGQAAHSTLEDVAEADGVLIYLHTGWAPF